VGLPLRLSRPASFFCRGIRSEPAILFKLGAISGFRWARATSVGIDMGPRHGFADRRSGWPLKSERLFRLCVEVRWAPALVRQNTALVAVRLWTDMGVDHPSDRECTDGASQTGGMPRPYCCLPRSQPVRLACYAGLQLPPAAALMVRCCSGKHPSDRRASARQA